MPEEVGVNLFWHKNFLFDFSNLVIYNDLCACKLSYAVPDITKKDAPVKTVHFSVEKIKYTMHVCKVCVCIAEARLPVSRCPERSYL